MLNATGRDVHAAYPLPRSWVPHAFITMCAAGDGYVAPAAGRRTRASLCQHQLRDSISQVDRSQIHEPGDRHPEGVGLGDAIRHLG